MRAIFVLKYDKDINFKGSIAITCNFNFYKRKTRLKKLIIFKYLYFYRVKRVGADAILTKSAENQ